MISTKEERIEKAHEHLRVLVGSFLFCVKLLSISYGTTKKPTTLPVGTNYTNKEWLLIREVANKYLNHRDISIQLLFELEEIINKYQDLLFINDAVKPPPLGVGIQGISKPKY
jgi:hypothetical protein